ncbi:Uncharacterised protein [Vibrio cholerae]|nr:Uncharacterised protein [Vibrio cholerae]
MAFGLCMEKGITYFCNKTQSRFTSMIIPQ